jgi:uncharacterized protein (TIGR02186 family)
MTRAAVLFIITLFAAAEARAENLVISLSTQRVAITSNYTGADIAVFGVIQRDAASVGRAGLYDAVVTVRGPRQTTIVRQKEPLGPIWLNRTQRRFVDLPAFLTVLATRPLDEVAPAAMRMRYKIGIDALLTPPGIELDFDTQEARFREALLRLKTADGLFAENAKGITFLTPNVFQGTIPLPATAPSGTYDVEVALLAAGTPIARESLAFVVTKSGFEETMTWASRNQPWLYGASAALMALAFGWVATVVFRRD